MAENKKEKWISIMIIPEDGAGVKKWRITTRMLTLLKILLGVSGLLLLAGFLSLFSLGILYFKMNQYRQSNARLLTATEQLNAIENRLEKFEEKERTLRDLLGGFIELPGATEQESTAIRQNSAATGFSSSGNEVEQAIARHETMLRHKPDIWPVRAWQVSDRFKNENDSRKGHLGIDIIAPKGSNVNAAADGRVIVAGNDELLGQLVAIDHENGWETRYGHNDLILVKYGDSVRKGQPIALYGGKNYSGTGAHLHFEMYYQGKAVNPLDHLPKLPLMKVTGK